MMVPTMVNERANMITARIVAAMVWARSMSNATLLAGMSLLTTE